MFGQSDQNLKYDTYIENLKAQGFFYACYELPEELEKR